MSESENKPETESQESKEQNPLTEDQRVRDLCNREATP